MTNTIKLYKIKGEDRIIEGCIPSNGAVKFVSDNVIVVNGTNFEFYFNHEIEFDKKSYLSDKIQSMIDKKMKQHKELVMQSGRIANMTTIVVSMIKSKYKKNRVTIPKEIRRKYNMGVLPLYLSVFEDKLYIQDKGLLFGTTIFSDKESIEDFGGFWKENLYDFLKDMKKNIDGFLKCVAIKHGNNTVSIGNKEVIEDFFGIWK